MYYNIFLYLIIKLARKINHRLKEKDYANSIFWGLVLVKSWFFPFVFDPVFSYFFPEILKKFHYDRFISVEAGLVAGTMLFEYFILFHRDQWKFRIKTVQALPVKERRRKSWIIIIITCLLVAGTVFLEVRNW